MTNYQLVRTLVAARLRAMIPDPAMFESYIGRSLDQEEARELCELFAKYTDDLAGKITPKTRIRR